MSDTRLLAVTACCPHVCPFCGGCADCCQGHDEASQASHRQRHRAAIRKARARNNEYQRRAKAGGLSDG